MDLVISKEKTWVYIDSFNLYYAALQKNGKRGLRWLDLESWLNKILVQNEIEKIKFFTAKVSGKYDPTAPVRQATYFRALETLSTVEIIEGKFLFRWQKVHITDDVSIVARVAEEKGTDVNLAAHLVADAYKQSFETAIVVSNDSDLAGAVKIVTQDVGLKVGILSPHETFNRELAKYATFKILVRETAIMKSQFPSTLTDEVGTFTKPPSW
jgi:uncharacterized LabA/DUF88 family protein